METTKRKRAIVPYMAIGLSVAAYCIANRRHIRKNLQMTGFFRKDPPYLGEGM